MTSECSDVLTKLRNDLGLSVDECAKVAKCHPETWEKLERGELDLPVILVTLVSKFAPKISESDSDGRSPSNRTTLPGESKR